MEIPETKCFIPKGFELDTTLSQPNRSIFCDLGIGATPKLFLHAWFLNQNPNIEKVKKFTGKDKQIGLFAKDMKKKKKKKCEAGYQLIPLYEKDHISSSKFLWKTKPCVNFKVQFSKQIN